MSTEIELCHLTKIFPLQEGNLTVLDDINLTVQNQEFISLVGASGSGKSTLLSLIAGLEAPTQGEILQQGRPVTQPSAERGLVFQSYTLFPWLTVRQNMGFGLELRGMTGRELKQRVDAYLEIIGLTTFAQQYPQQLSGGMQQRVALARALINEPRVLLLDEPFAALDTQTRSLMQDFLYGLWQRNPLTVILVTHDVSEALYLSQKVYLLTSRPGKLTQEFNVDFAERTPEIRLNPLFQQLQAQILQSLRIEALKTFN